MNSRIKAIILLILIELGNLLLALLAFSVIGGVVFATFLTIWPAKEYMGLIAILSIMTTLLLFKFLFDGGKN